VHPTIQWAKLEALAEGARLASRELWGRGKKAAKKPAPKKTAKKRSAKKKRAA
jgi:5-methyltetrahydropteroyltriglutamate--homocysteine methyltransferase